MTRQLNLIFILFTVTFFYSCQNSTPSQQKEDNLPDDDENTYTDLRDGQKYSMVVIGDSEWLAENMRYNIEGSLLPPGYNYGRYYTWKQAIRACPLGWSLPEKGDFKELYRVSEEIERGFELLKSRDSWKDSFKVSYDTKGFNLMASGVFYGDEVELKLEGQGEFAWIWGREEDVYLQKEGKKIEASRIYPKHSKDTFSFYNKEEEVTWAEAIAQDRARSYLYFAIEGNLPPFSSSLQANLEGYLPCRCVRKNKNIVSEN